MKDIKTTNIKYALNKLKKLTKSKNYSEIKTILRSFYSYKRGRLFEEYLEYLFNGNGFIAIRKGGTNDGGADIILFSKLNPKNVIWVIQAKNSNKALSLNEIYNELSKFERCSSTRYKCRNFKIISINGYKNNTNIFSKSNMILEDFDYVKLLIDNYSNGKNSPSINPDLMPHNIYSYKESKIILQSNNRVAIPNATGTGKSLIIAQFLYDYLEKNSLVIAPSNDILSQLKQKVQWCTQKCSFYTYSKLDSMFKSNKLSNLHYDLLIFDEMHRAGALEWGKAINYILNNNPNSKVVGLSATPVRFLDNNRDMIEEIFNNNSTTPLSLSDAIARRILPNPIYVSSVYNLDKDIDRLISLMSKLCISDDSRNTYTKELIDFKNSWEKDNNLRNIVKTYLDKNKKNIKFIVFCENINHLKKMQGDVISWFSDVYGSSTKVRSYIITSRHSRNAKELSDFDNNNIKDEIKLMFCVDKLNEGIHLNNLTGIIMLRNTKSPVIYYQQLGRCLATDLVGTTPIVFDFVDNIDNLELINFRSALSESIKRNNKYRKKLGLKIYNLKICTYEEHINVVKKIRNIEERITHNWDDYYDELKKFKNINGHCNVTKNNKYEKLYNWTALQRTLYSKKTLTAERINKLNDLDFSWDLKFYKWQKNLYEYIDAVKNLSSFNIAYFEIISSCYCLPIYRCSSMYPFKLYGWIRRQLKSFKHKTMPEDKYKLFTKLFININNLENNEWIKSLIKLKLFFNMLEINLKIPKDKLSRMSMGSYLLRSAITNKCSDYYFYSNEFTNTFDKTIENADIPSFGLDFSIEHTINLAKENHITDTTWYSCFIYFCIKTSQHNMNFDFYINDINFKYILSTIFECSYLIDFWFKYCLSDTVLDEDRRILLSSINVDNSFYNLP